MEKSKYKDRVQTQVMCSASLKAKAKKIGISLSTSLEEMLEVKIDAPSERALIENQLKDLKIETDVLLQKLAVLDAKEAEEIKENKEAKQLKDIEICRRLYKGIINGTDKGQFKKAIEMFCEKYDLEYGQAVKVVLK